MNTDLRDLAWSWAAVIADRYGWDSDAANLARVLAEHLADGSIFDLTESSFDILAKSVGLESWEGHRILSRWLSDGIFNPPLQSL